MVQATDVTAFVIASREKEDLERRVQQQWAELEAIYKAASIGLALYDPEHFRLLRLNEKMAEILGVPAGEVLGRSIADIAHRIPDLPGLFKKVAEERNSKSQLIGQVAAITTNLLYLAIGHENPIEVQELLKQADRELRRVSKIANQTLRFHKQASKPQLLSTESLFEAVLLVFEGRLRNSNIQVEARGYAEQPVECFEGDIRQVLANLVGNAVDAMPRGGRLVIRSRQGTEWSSGRLGLFLTVADNGCGVSPDSKAKLFEAFFTTKGIGGTGLGLWISADIMERHQGRIRLRSSQESRRRGTVVMLFLPHCQIGKLTSCNTDAGWLSRAAAAVSECFQHTHDSGGITTRAADRDRSTACKRLKWLKRSGVA